MIKALTIGLLALIYFGKGRFKEICGTCFDRNHCPTLFPGDLLMIDHLDGEKKDVALLQSLNFRKIGLEYEGR